MTEPANGSTKKIVGYPINLQSLLQTMVIASTLVMGVVYADRRITTLEMNYQFQARQAEEQKIMMRESLDKLNKSLENQERMLREQREANGNARGKR
jgi:hypothetical protein